MRKVLNLHSKNLKRKSKYRNVKIFYSPVLHLFIQPTIAFKLFNRRKNYVFIMEFNEWTDAAFEKVVLQKYRCNRSEAFCEKDVIKSITTKLTGKHLCQSFFFNISCEFCKNTCFTEHFWGMDIHQNSCFTEYQADYIITV